MGRVWPLEAERLAEKGLSASGGLHLGGTHFVGKLLHEPDEIVDLLIVPAGETRPKKTVAGGVDTVGDDLPRLVAAVGGVLAAAKAGQFSLPSRTLALSEVERGWSLPDRARTVFEMA